MHVLVTRPESESVALAQLLREQGHVPILCPLLDVAVRDERIDLGGVQGLVFTSAAGVRAFARLSPRRDLPAFAVGDATAAVAREVGFASVHSAHGDSDDLVEYLGANVDANAGALLHASGTQVAGDIAAPLAARGFHYRRVALYEAVQAAALPEEGRRALQQGPLEAVLFFSPRTAEAFVSLVNEAGLGARCTSLTAFCLSSAVAAKAAALPWSAVRTATAPTQPSLLALLPAGTRA